MQTDNSTEEFPALSEEAQKCFQVILDAGSAPENDISKINGAVMDYLLAILTPENEGKQTCIEISLLERRLRAAESSIYCVARTAAPPEYCARTHRNETLDYYLQLANGLEALQVLLDEEKINVAENLKRLETTGVRVRDRHEERKKSPLLKLPLDLNARRAKEMYFNKPSLILFAPTVDPSLLVKHALAISQNTLGDDLCGTMIETLRIGVEYQEWNSNVRETLKKTIQDRTPFAQQQTAITSVRQDLIPIGYHAIGTTFDQTYSSKQQENQAAELVLIDLYAWQARRFYVHLKQSEIDQMEATPTDVSKFIDILAASAGVANCELESIQTLDDVKRCFVIAPIAE